MEREGDGDREKEIYRQRDIQNEGDGDRERYMQREGNRDREIG